MASVMEGSMTVLLRGSATMLALTIALPAAGQSVTVSPAGPDLAAGTQAGFSAEVRHLADHDVSWLVEGLRFGAPSLGRMGGGGLYTAPVDPDGTIQVPVEAASAAVPTLSGSATATIAPPKWSGQTFYVATGGLDTNPGTESQPFLTIQHAVDTVPAGAAIEVEPGVYNEVVTITRSGSATAGFISVEGQSGAIVDGTGLPVPNGEAGLFTIQNASWIRVSGFEIRNFASASAADVPVGIYLVGSGAHIEITNNHVHDITTSVTTSSGDALGIAVYGTSATTPIEDVTIDGNELDDLITGFSESLALSGNVVFWQVTDNLIHDNDNIGIDIGGFEGFAPDPSVDRARKGLVAGNIVYDISSIDNPAYGGSYGADGIYVDGGTDVTIQQNLVHDTDIGIEMASEHFGHKSTYVITRDNVVYSSNLEGISIGGYRAQAGGTAYCIIVNNTLYHNDTTQSGSGEFQIQLHARDNVFKNNVVYANTQGLLVNSFVATEADPAAMNRNLYFTDASTPQFVWLGRSYSGLAAYQAGTGLESHGVYGNPLFAAAAAATPNLQLSADSPALGAGKDLGLPTLGLYDFAGNPRVVSGSVDMGAYQN
jgi:hypothetical protein